MKILYTANGDAALIRERFSNTLPSPNRASECLRFLSEVKEGSKRAKAARLFEKDIKALVSKCEPARFMLLRELIKFMRADISRFFPAQKDIAEIKKALLRFSLGLFAISCGAKELVLSCGKEVFTKEHALSSRLLGVKEVLLCSELDCAAIAAFSSDCKLLYGFGSEEFCMLAGAVSPFTQTIVSKESNGSIFVMTHPYDSELVYLDIKRELTRASNRQILLITSDEKDISHRFEDIAEERLILLLTASDKESVALAKKFDGFAVTAYGSNCGDLLCGDALPPVMREAVLPSAAFKLLPNGNADTLSDSRKDIPSLFEFAQAISKYVDKGLSGEDKDTVSARFQKN